MATIEGINGIDKKKVGFLLAFEMHSHGSMDWSNPPIPKEYPFLSVELLDAFFYRCIDH